ncbi:MAG: PTS IIA-like nitrogen regulatory protein PtsN [Alphaproteobacteria bacterium]|nr:PTS IIA-like nitrogen regulatory protein PtsN [Alphaproteobacteria bacterium]
MQICDILSKTCIVVNNEPNNKKQVLEQLAKLATKQTGVETNVILDALIERERLGTTGVGRGVALPHTRLIGLNKIFCAFMKTTAIDFESVDGKLVDLVFLLLVPEEAGADHLKALGHLSRLLRDDSIANQLRMENTIDGLYQIITENDSEEDA